MGMMRCMGCVLKKTDSCMCIKGLDISSTERGEARKVLVTA